jgi:hypothetical protein
MFGTFNIFKYFFLLGPILTYLIASHRAASTWPSGSEWTFEGSGKFSNWQTMLLHFYLHLKLQKFSIKLFYSLYKSKNNRTIWFTAGHHLSHCRSREKEASALRGLKIDQDRSTLKTNSKWRYSNNCCVCITFTFLTRQLCIQHYLGLNQSAKCFIYILSNLIGKQHLLILYI